MRPISPQPDTTKCQRSTVVDRFNRTLRCDKHQSIVPDVLIQPNSKCVPFMSYRCENCGCYLCTQGWYLCKKGGGAYIVGWNIIGSCAIAQISRPGTGRSSCYGTDAIPPMGYSVPGCRRFGKILTYSKPTPKNIICFDLKKIQTSDEQ